MSASYNNRPGMRWLWLELYCLLWWVCWHGDTLEQVIF